MQCWLNTQILTQWFLWKAEGWPCLFECVIPMSKEHIGLRTWSVFVFVFLLAIEDIVEVVQSDSGCVCGVRVRAISCFTEPGTEWYEMQVCKVDNIAHWREEGCIGKYIPQGPTDFSGCISQTQGSVQPLFVYGFVYIVYIEPICIITAALSTFSTRECVSDICPRKRIS